MNKLFKIETTEKLGEWYNNKYKEMGGGWITHPKDLVKHIDRLLEYKGEQSTLLDIGFGGGCFLAEFLI